MKRFSFNLESVLDHRKLLEELEELKLNRVNQSILEMETLRQRMRDEAVECRNLLHQPTPGEINVEQMRHLVLYLNKLDQEIHQSTLLLIRLEEDRRQQSEKLIEARKKREILEKLKDKSFSHYQSELKGMEQKLLDELVTERFGLGDAQNLPGSNTNS
jgi:flagellar FliJ protein